jgi:hypothetical protein
MGVGPGAQHPSAIRWGRNAVKDRDVQEIWLARKTKGRGNLLDWTVAAHQPEAKPCPHQDSRQNKAAVLANLCFQRTHGHGTATVRQPSGMTPDTIKIEIFVCKDECPMAIGVAEIVAGGDCSGQGDGRSVKLDHCRTGSSIEVGPAPE